MNKRKITVFAKGRLESDLLNGRMPLNNVPRNIRLRNTTYYIYAFRYYQYFKNIDNPYDVLYSDIKSLPQGIQRQELHELYNDYLSMEQRHERKQASTYLEMVEDS